MTEQSSTSLSSLDKEETVKTKQSKVKSKLPTSALLNAIKIMEEPFQQSVSFTKYTTGRKNGVLKENSPQRMIKKHLATEQAV
jgi:hypothetical protein